MSRITSVQRWSAAPFVLAALALALAPATATADIVEYPKNPSATPLARAMAGDASIVRRGVFSALPPSSKPAAVSTTKLAGFPRSGSSFAILSTGNARIADDPNDARDSGSESRGPSIRGARDVVIMRIDLRIPRNANCLSFNFRFLSEEYPEFVGNIYNDAFIAELDRSTWNTGTTEDPAINAPDNFAIDRNKNPIRINKAGIDTMTRRNARGTTIDGATRMLRASTRITPGDHRLYLSVFDQGDRIYDSAVFLDNLRANRRTPCRSGLAVERD
jgi:hypothetical protein